MLRRCVLWLGHVCTACAQKYVVMRQARGETAEVRWQQSAKEISQGRTGDTNVLEPGTKAANRAPLNRSEVRGHLGF